MGLKLEEKSNKISNFLPLNFVPITDMTMKYSWEDKIALCIKKTKEREYKNLIKNVYSAWVKGQIRKNQIINVSKIYFLNIMRALMFAEREDFLHI